MIFSSVATVLLIALPAQSDALLAEVRAAALAGDYARLEAAFVPGSYPLYLRQMIGDTNRLKRIGISAFPAPPGLDTFGETWVIFHRYQRLEHDHDVVVPIVPTGEGAKLGTEIPEDVAVPYSIDHLDFEVSLHPSDLRATFKTTATIAKTTGSGTSVFMRMNDAYRVRTATYNGSAVQVQTGASPTEFVVAGSAPRIIQSGGALYLTNAGAGGKLQLEYSVSVDEPGCDQVVSNQALFTSYWYPHIGRRPAKSRVKIEGPAGWLLLGNGNQTSDQTRAGRRVVTFDNPIPISYHHIVGGEYKLAYECKDRGRTFRTWHFGSVDAERGKHDAEMARDSTAFFEDRYGPFPYNGYDVVDTPEFYGVECYSFTVLTPGITSWATSHEVGHTYFGGLAPSTYIRSIWNEGVTQYVDSVLFKQNSDRSLEAGYGARNSKIALAQPFLAHGPYGNVGYYRGAFTMAMLDKEIGIDVMNKCLRELATVRKGIVTDWHDIEKIFARVSGQDVGWFWDQWIRGSTFPSVGLTRAFVEPGPIGGFNTHVELAQNGTAAPYRLRFIAVLRTPSGERRFDVRMTTERQSFNWETSDRPSEIRFDPIGYTLATVPSQTKLP